MTPTKSQFRQFISNMNLVIKWVFASTKTEFFKQIAWRCSNACDCALYKQRQVHSVWDINFHT